MPQTFAAEHWTQSRLRSCGISETVSRSVPRSTSSVTFFADLLAGQRPDQIIGAGNGRAVETQHDVAGFEAGAVGGALRLDGADHHGVVLQHDRWRGVAVP